MITVLAVGLRHCTVLLPTPRTITSPHPQIGSVIRIFAIGTERVAAAALLFTRAADASTDLVSLTSVMSGHDLLGWRDVLGWYSGCRWNQPTGGQGLGLWIGCITSALVPTRVLFFACQDGSDIVRAGACQWANKVNVQLCMC